MTYEEENRQRFQKLAGIAAQQATGMDIPIEQLHDEFNSYFAWHEKAVVRGLLASFGGQDGSYHNRKVLAGKIELAIGRRVTLEQMEKLDDTLGYIARHYGEGVLDLRV